MIDYQSILLKQTIQNLDTQTYNNLLSFATELGYWPLE